MEYQINSHCKYLIGLHLILVVKYRKQILTGEIGEFMKSCVDRLAENSAFDIEEMEIDKDHIQLLLTIKPDISVSQYVRRIKQSTTQSIWGKFPLLKQQFWREKTFWSDGYFVCSVGNASAATIRRYIQEQG
jgi:putative transposase